ncbi:phospholipase A1-IIdelta-like [Cynara cardunculus var. scolymus]|uniref:Phospholipase A1 n=1 Tax=Cynara cardunculus var. scolymus TaxID=59895 RepID=A0A118JYA6_CYNCS|nr:phospholipase A1-IIdelta-like [Cynara cardunculus var. scolymus]KVH98276.1 Lipase, class 3 [Cynara cardunculus var. scolymus]
MALTTYEELHGSNNWDGLLDPLNPDLRTLILGYGDLASAAERALNNNENAKYSGYSQYGKSSFFKGVMLPLAESKYNVTSFIYATAHVDISLGFLIHDKSREKSDFESNWMGYVAVSNDEFSKSIGRREICVVWRGTVRTYEWINDIKDAGPVPADPLLPPANDKSITSLIGAAIDKPKVMEGWLIIYNTSNPNSKLVKTSARTQLLARIRELLVKYKDEKITITCVGHSLGGSLATVSAFDLAANVATPDIKVSAFVFASPQVGNQAFKKKMEELPNLKVLSIKNVNDIIPKWPSKIMEWMDGKLNLVKIPKDVMLYVDVGIHLMVDSKKSPFFKEKGGLDIVHALDFHNLEGMLHTVAGYDGKDREFNWKSVEKRRSLALVNMSADLLKEKYQIPQSWWSEKHKGMVLNESGEWVLSPLDRDDHDLSPPTAATVTYQV